MLEYAPVTRAQVTDGGMKLAALCAAALQQSDNTAGNLLLREIGGPAGLTKSLRAIGDPVTRLDRTEPALNEGAPGDERDTTTPVAMRANLQRLLTGKVLTASSRARLQEWMAGNTTGDAMIRAGVPADWKVATKQAEAGTERSTTSPCFSRLGSAPIFLAIYTDMPASSPEARNEVVAQVARLVAESFLNMR